MTRQIALLGAPSSIGIRPYDSGEQRHLDRAPSVLRELGLVDRLGARDLGDVVPPPYRDYVRPPGRARNEEGVDDVAAAALAAIAPPDSHAAAGGFWIHVDADVIDGTIMPAVDSPEPGGPTIDELVNLLKPLAHHPRALGLELTIYDPALDGDGSCAARLVTLLEKLLVGTGTIREAR